MVIESHILATFEHEGQKIGLTKDGHFVVEGVRNGFDTLLKAQEEIEKNKKYKFVASKEKVALKVLTRDGRITVITGISRTDQQFITEPKLANHSYNRMQYYVYTEQVAKLIEEATFLENRAASLRKQLSKCEVEHKGYGRLEAERYQEELGNLSDAYALALKNVEFVETV